MGERIYTSNEYKRLGERIRSNPLNISEDDYLALQELRLTFSLPEKQLSKKDKYFIADTIIKYNYIEKIGEVFARNYLDVRRQWNKMRLQRNHFFLISTGSDGIPDFMGFNIFEDAERAYFDKFVNNNDNRNIVLTHLQEASFTKISIAYSNYFLTFNNTIMQVLVYLSDAVTNSYHQNKVSSFCRYYQCFLDMIAFWIEEQRLEMTSYNKDNIARNSRLLRTEWTNSINNGINALNYIMWKMHQRLSFNLLKIVPYYRMKQIQKQFKRKYGHANH